MGEPGLWFNAQMISFSDLAENDQAWRKEFKAVEDYWVQELGARPHMGKLWGLEEVADGDIEPFSHAESTRRKQKTLSTRIERYGIQKDCFLQAWVHIYWGRVLDSDGHAAHSFGEWSCKWGQLGTLYR